MPGISSKRRNTLTEALLKVEPKNSLIFSHSQELRGTAGQQEMALTAFFFLRRKQRCLRYTLPTLAGGSDKTGSLGRPTHGAVPAEYKDTPLGCCWV